MNSNEVTENRVQEPSRSTPLVEKVDVLVAGGGPAGVVAAIAAGRSGARTRLIEVAGCLGGVWTSGLLSWILDHDTKTGLMREIMRELDARGARRDNAYDPEIMKLLLEQMCVEAGVEVRLHTRVVAAVRDEYGDLAVAITESKSGREAWAASVFIDATGDGDLAALAGCGYDLGNAHGETQPMTLMAMITGVEYDALYAEGLVYGDGVEINESKANLRHQMNLAGVEPSYGSPTIFPIRDDLFGIMLNHEYGGSGLDAQSMTDATLNARLEIHSVIDALRSLGGVWSGL